MHEQATLVAFYGEKREPLASLIRDLQQTIVAELGSAFTSYALEQVHATIIGLESTPADPRLHRSRQSRGGNADPMDLAGYLRFLREAGELPFTVQISGFRDRPYPFESRSQRPYLRSFSLQGEFAVLMGWPIEARESADPLAAATRSADPGQSHPASLARIRRSAESFQIVHQYHVAPGDSDNDLYLRLGILARDRISDAHASRLEEMIRERLAAMPATIMLVDADDLSVISYTDPGLPWPDSTRWPLPEIDLDSDLVGCFYPKLPET